MIAVGKLETLTEAHALRITALEDKYDSINGKLWAVLASILVTLAYVVVAVH